ncbi:MAG: BBP7 family outer membrane beta-barrel protein [Planctomycetia bacterium]|nr:BBP7 family outer membrane beta-barrel protein [Planctomycetia bacterium]
MKRLSWWNLPSLNLRQLGFGGMLATALALLPAAGDTAHAEAPPVSPSDRLIADLNRDEAPAARATDQTTATATDRATLEDDCFAEDDCGWNWISARVGAVGLHRSGNQNHVLLSEVGTGDPVLSSGDVSPGWGVGPEVDLLVHFSPCVDLEIDWFSLGDWSHQHTVDVNGADVDPFGTSLESGQVRNESKFRNFELNLRQNYSDRLTFLAGFRYIELQDLFGLHYEGIGGGADYEDAAIRTSNHLYGFQLGADGVLWERGDWRLNGWLKAGLYGNAAQHNTEIEISGTPLASIHARESDLAFVGDLGLRGTRRLGPHLEAYAGYRVMFVDGVALSINQYDSIVEYFNTGTPQMTTNGNPFYHGAEAGVTISY